MKKLLGVGFFYLLSTVVHAAVQVQIDSSQVNMNETFRLILTQDDLQNGGIPDLTPLQKDFIILGTERRINYSIINGHAQSSNEWTITLKPQKKGKLIIPAIKIGNDYTTSTTIDVTANTNKQNTSDDSILQQDVYLTTKVDKRKPFVNQQIIYKVTLYNSKRLLNASYQGPQVENALVIPLGDEKRYQTQKNNITYLVEEQDYAIFPQKSGTLKIKSPIFSALIYDFNPEHIKVKDKTINLNVHPIPKEYSGKEWFPATEVRLRENYEHPNQAIAQGNTLIRNVTLEGVGIPAQLLPTLNFTEAEGFNVYPEKGKNKNQISQGQLVGRTEFKVTYLFNKPGKITIPEVKLPWFNTETGKEEIATLPARIIKVLPSNTMSVTNKNQQSIVKRQKIQQTIQETNVPPTPTKINWAWIVAAFFALIWLITITLWGLQKRNKNMGKGKYKTALSGLHKACTQGNPQQARDALLQWAGLHWPDAPILNLSHLASLTTDAAFKKQIQILSQILYKNQEKTLWRGDELWRSILSITKTSTSKKEKISVLPPINPLG